MKLFYYTLLTVLIFGCSGATSPDGTDSYASMLIPNKIGNYWVYQRNAFGKTIGYDSLVLSKKMLFKGKSASLIEINRLSENMKPISKDTLYFAEEGNELFIVENNPVRPWHSSDWIQIYGDRNSSWIAARFDIWKTDLYVIDSIVKGALTNVLTGKYIYSDTVNISGVTSQFDMFTLKNDFKGSFYQHVVSNGKLDSVLYQSVGKYNMHYKIARGLGLVSKTYESHMIYWLPVDNKYGLKTKSIQVADESLRLIRYKF